jgi:hypothetical protein
VKSSRPTALCIYGSFNPCYAWPRLPYGGNIASLAAAALTIRGARPNWRRISCLRLAKEPPALYKGQHDVQMRYHALKTMYR